MNNMERQKMTEMKMCDIADQFAETSDKYPIMKVKELAGYKFDIVDMVVREKLQTGDYAPTDTVIATVEIEGDKAVVFFRQKAIYKLLKKFSEEYPGDSLTECMVVLKHSKAGNDYWVLEGYDEEVAEEMGNRIL